MAARRPVARILVAVLALSWVSLQAAGGRNSINPGDLKTWLTYLASDELEGRAVFTEGLGLAAGYISAHLSEWGVKPAGDHGGYLQTVRVLGVKVTSRSSVTVKVGNETRTFKDGEGVTFPRNSGAKRDLEIDRVEFAGYGLEAPGVGHSDFRSRAPVSGAAVIYLGNNGPDGLNAQDARRVLNGRSRYLTDQLRAAASVTSAPPRPTPPAAPAAPGASVPDTGAAPTGGQGTGQAGAPAGTAASAAPLPPPATVQGRANAPDFTTTQRLDQPIPPSVTASDEFLEFMFSRAPTHYADLKQKAADRAPLTPFHLDGVTITFHIDADYSVVRTQLTQNVVGMVEGSDTSLKSTYVAFGAHYDHVGFAENELTAEGRRPTPPGRVTDGASADRIWNGADDDGSGTVTLMAIARAFAEGPKPKRSVIFVWHAGEERGLLGSRYFADYPTVPMDRIVTQLNIDMIGRNRDDKKSEENTVYLVGSDRISSELHQINRDANRALNPPLTLDYEMNDPSDPEQVYYRSDHYSYAAKGVPIIFFTTGLHADYHANTDEVGKIEFAKMARIGQLIYETGWRVASLDHAPARDNQGPRAGKGTR